MESNLWYVQTSTHAISSLVFLQSDPGEGACFAVLTHKNHHSRWEIWSILDFRPRIFRGQCSCFTLGTWKLHSSQSVVGNPGEFKDCRLIHYILVPLRAYLTCCKMFHVEKKKLISWVKLFLPHKWLLATLFCFSTRVIV